MFFGVWQVHKLQLEKACRFLRQAFSNYSLSYNKL